MKMTEYNTLGEDEIKKNIQRLLLKRYITSPST